MALRITAWPAHHPNGARVRPYRSTPGIARRTVLLGSRGIAVHACAADRCRRVHRHPIAPLRLGEVAHLVGAGDQVAHVNVPSLKFTWPMLTPTPNTSPCQLKRNPATASRNRSATTSACSGMGLSRHGEFVATQPREHVAIAQVLLQQHRQLP